ncbi:MAG TPA: cytochrome c [Steroidobacteraceae bacterium]
MTGDAGAAPAAPAFALLAALGLAGSGATADTPPDYPQGGASFQSNCAVCHGPAGAGLPALAPPLLSYPARYAASAEGRRQLAMTVLYGMYGDVVVDGRHYAFRMPEFGQLDDASLAALLNFVVFEVAHAPASVAPLTAAEIAAERAHPLDGAAVREHRKSVAPEEP